MIPAETQVLNEVELRLRNITKDNGYSLDIKKFTRGKLTPYVAGDIPAINYWPVTHPMDEKTYDETTHILRLVVDARNVSADARSKSKKAGKNFPDEAALMIADIVTAINRAPGAPKVSDPVDCDFEETVTSVKTPFSAYQIGEGQTPWVGAIVEIEIEYQSEPGDMFNYQP